MNDRKEYAYLLCIGGKIKKLITVWWSSPQEMTDNMAAMHAAAYAFKKTAAILVYEHKNGGGCAFPQKFATYQAAFETLEHFRPGVKLTERINGAGDIEIY